MSYLACQSYKTNETFVIFNSVWMLLKSARNPCLSLITHLTAVKIEVRHHQESVELVYIVYR